jgi:selenocysteine-specific elongation factor
MPMTLGTAGHIDHGKTALVRALTGVDTDRLPEEKARGISIALGYAALDLPSGRRLSVVDVPGHERFVRTMVAGASGIDLFLMVVAADDGVMPQTREHAAVLGALGVGAGVVAVTKADLADPLPAAAQARELLPGAEAVAVATPSGSGVPELLAALDRAAAGAASRATADAPLRLHVDRVFTVRGAGTVVTGTLWSGTVARGDQVVLEPGARRARVRAVQVHDEPMEAAQAGQRVALNLVGRIQPARGDVVVGEAGGAAASYRVVAELALGPLPPRVMVHHGTREAPAHPVHLGGDRWQLRLRAPIVAAPGDRLVIRSIAPPDTLGGGVIVEIPERGPAPAPVAAPPADPAGPAPLTDAALAVEARLREAWTTPPLDAELDAPEELAALRAHARAVRVGRTMHFHADALAEVRGRLVAILEAEQSVTLARFRDELGFSRKYAQALLEHFDGERLTLRRGEARVLRGRRAP